MAEACISSLHIQKLGHKIEEIRIRALHNILSKLDSGIIYDNELPRNMELLNRLLAWFKFDPVLEERRVLDLLDRIFKSGSGQSLLTYLGPNTLIEELEKIKSRISSKYHEKVNKMIEKIRGNESGRSEQEACDVVPPLVSELPLSYRSGDSDLYRLAAGDQASTRTNSATLRKLDKVDVSKTFTHRTQEANSNKGTADESQSPDVPPLNFGNSDTSPVCSASVQENCVPYLVLEWQPLVTTDVHVLQSVEATVRSPPHPSILLHSTQFFISVMLQDFPPEVFLQRPTVVLLFHELLTSSQSTRVVNAVLTCLRKLTEKLLGQIQYCSDPSTRNLKQKIFTKNDESTEHSTVRKSPEEFGDVLEMQCQQMSVPVYCLETWCSVLTFISENRLTFQDQVNKRKIQSCMNTALQLLDRLAALLSVCVRPSVWEARDERAMDIASRTNTALTLLGDLLDQLRLMVATTEMEYFERVAQLHLLNTTSVLLTALIPVNRAGTLLPRNLKNSLSSSLLDSAFGRIFPRTHETLFLYVTEFAGRFETENFSKYKELKQVCNAMSAAVRFLRQTQIKSLHLLQKSLPSLEFHKNYDIIESFFNICVKQSINEELQKVIDNILVTLLSHEDEPIRTEMYSRSRKLIKNHLGVNHIKNESNSHILFFIRPDVITEIAAHGLTSEMEDIQSMANDIIIHIIKCKFLVSEKIWKNIIDSVLPTMAVLQCHTNKNTALGKAILRMMDPDICPSISVPPLDVIKGNLRYLYHKDCTIRNEAVSRLCWLLTTEKDYEAKIPKIKTLDDCALSNIFQFNHHLDLTKLKSPKQFYQVSSLQQVLGLLESPLAEPAVRRSALQQVSVMITDHFMHTSFLERNGLEITLRILHNALLESQHHVYPDSVQPCASILKNLCLHNTVVRKELAINLDLYYCLLRTLLLYSTEKQIQQDGSVLLCLLLFDEYILNHQRDKALSLPYVVVNKLNIPFRCGTHWKHSRHAKPKLSDILSSDEWCRSTLRMHWNIEYFGGIKEILSSPRPAQEFHSDLHLTKEDLNALKASSVLYCSQKYLYDIQNAIKHSDVMECLRGLHGYLSLWLLNESDHTKLLSLPWCQSFTRFLTAPPANEDDTNLLVELLQVLSLLLKLKSDNCWIKQILFDSRHHLGKLLQNEVHTDNRSVSLQLLSLISETVDQTFLNSQKNIFMINVLTDNLKFNDSGQFYNLAYLDRLLLCLVHLTSTPGWSEERHPDVEITKMLTELIEGLAELLNAFHHGKGTDASSSFMGLSITRNALTTMNHVLNEMQTYKKNWESFWLCDTVCESMLLSLNTLWRSRDVLVRASTLQLLSGLALSPRGTTAVVNSMCRGQVWLGALKVLLDHTEASVVREQAAMLLTNISSHGNVSSTGHVTLPLCHSCVTDRSLSPNEALLALLKQLNFFEELNELFLCLHLKCQRLEQTRSFHSIRGEEQYVLTTPSLIRATTLFINNLMWIYPEEISQSLYEHSTVRSLFRCLSIPPLDARDGRPLLLYCSTIEMSASVCLLLARIAVVSRPCSSMLLSTRDCLHVLISLLNPELFSEARPNLTNLTYKLWIEIFNLLSVLMNQDLNDLPTLLIECPNFVNTILISIDSKITQLQKNALKFLTVLLSGEARSGPCHKSSVLSIVTLFDRNQLEEFYHDDIENKDPLSNSNKSFGSDILQNKNSSGIIKSDSSTSAGTNICKSLLTMYETQNWETPKDYKKRCVIIGALGSLLNVSEEAKKCALNEDLLSNVISNLKNLQLELSIHSLDSLRKNSDKKKICPLLKEVELVLGMLTNFMLKSSSVKKAACDAGLGDLTHKFWTWCCSDRALLAVTLKMLCTFSSGCNESCQSLILTNPAAGSGPRKTPNGVSLLHAVVSLLLKEMDHVSRARDITVLTLCFHLLRNICSSVECRNVLAKSQLFQCFSKAHPVLTRHQKPWDTIENILLEFLLTFTFYPEGQISLAKSPDHVELLLNLATSTKCLDKLQALAVLRNMSFHHSNRVLLLSNVDFVRTLRTKLTQGTAEERHTVVTIMWALAANSQRSKIVLKCAGLDVCLQELVKQAQLQRYDVKLHNTMLYVLAMLKD